MAIGPHSFAVDARGRLHTGVEDGRILRFQGPNPDFTEFATTSVFRTQEACNASTETDSGPICARPLGIQFYYRTGQLYIADGTSGLLVVGQNGGNASLEATKIDGTLLNSVEALDIDQTNGVVYFSDAGSILRQTRSNTLQIFKNFEGNLDSIRRTQLGDFWMAVNVMMEPSMLVTLGQRVSELGTIVVIVNLTEVYNTSIVTQVYEYLGSLYIGSLDENFVGRYIF
ncbi:hypothetical protein LIER_10079 [Lithospermum erythrorhizon]|uniref:Strictosidine synthase conserved region domain-containing protein n=1 Tax=Lithospermum erythrorhizon TaxID=34254 RepID=A0AAV3PLZ0_LITER